MTRDRRVVSTATKLFLLLLLVYPSLCLAQPLTCIKELPGPNNCYKLTVPAGSPRGLVVLLPGFGDTVALFDLFRLPTIMRDRGYVVAAISMAGYINWESEVRTLHAIISKITDQHRVPPNSLAIGGFSAGATGALRYAQYCVEQQCSATTRAAAAFSVDGPLDFERWYNCSARRAGWLPGDPERWGMISNVLAKNLGGSPAEKRAAYVRAAPITASEPRGGNAALLKDTPIRAYSEPDVTWTIENWSADYYCQNSIDQAALVLELKMQGNKQAELIMTSGKGYRAEFVESTGTYRKGERSPHSWSIVDERNLADWIERHTRKSQ